MRFGSFTAGALVTLGAAAAAGAAAGAGGGATRAGALARTTGITGAGADAGSAARTGTAAAAGAETGAETGRAGARAAGPFGGGGSKSSSPMSTVSAGPAGVAPSSRTTGCGRPFLTGAMTVVSWRGAGGVTSGAGSNCRMSSISSAEITPAGAALTTGTTTAG